jgi:hypothetical protein
MNKFKKLMGRKVKAAPPKKDVDINKPKNEIIPLRLTKVIVESYDTDMNIMDKET